MLRAFFVSAVIWALSNVTPAIAGPTLGDDMELCRDKQAEDKAARLQACERVVAGGQASGKDLAIANAVRGQDFQRKRRYDKAIAAFDAAHAADPDEPTYINARGFS